jgi:hypothetical protein
MTCPAVALIVAALGVTTGAVLPTVACISTMFEGTFPSYTAKKRSSEPLVPAWKVTCDNWLAVTTTALGRPIGPHHRC